jgi:hypothetical protein
VVKKAARKSKVESTAASHATATYVPDFETLRHAIPQLDAVNRKGAMLPDDWTFRGVSIGEFRTFWSAIRAIALLHSAVVKAAMPPPTLATALLLVSSPSELANWICELVELNQARVQEIIGYHIYDRSSSTPDVALTPFLPVGRDLLAAAPSILWSSSFERNLAARLARDHGDEFAASTGMCATRMAEELKDRFQDRGFLARN